uniref:Protein phosphatase 1 regulatory subunit 14 n=2 Tax=Bos TaxID=9903 RepID=G3N0C3_BOVIN
MGCAEPQGGGRPVTWAAPVRLLHPSTPGSPVHVSVSAKTPLVPPLAEGRRTQKGGEWRSQSPPGAAGEGPGGADDEGPVRRQGKVTVKYDRKELRKRLNLEEWILEQLTRLYDCQEEEIPELEIDVDELLDMESDDTRAARVKELLVDCYKPTEAFISGLLDKIRGMQKLSTPQKK